MELIRNISLSLGLLTSSGSTSQNDAPHTLVMFRVLSSNLSLPPCKGFDSTNDEIKLPHNSAVCQAKKKNPKNRTIIASIG